MADKSIWTNSFKVTTQYSKGSILETPCFLAMQSSPSLTFTLTALATILPPASAISLGLRPFSTLANTYGSVVER